MEKIEDFGVQCKQYYSLEVSYFKSAMDERLLDWLKSDNKALEKQLNHWKQNFNQKGNRKEEDTFEPANDSCENGWPALWINN